MAFIHKEDFSVVTNVLDEKTKEDYFECDDMIAPTIALLNKKGYTTEFCCGGHPFPTIDFSMMSEYPNENEVLISVVPTCDKISELKTWEFLDQDGNAVSMEDAIKELPFYAVYKNIYADEIYIAFEHEHHFVKIPEGFEFDNYNGKTKIASGVFAEGVEDFSGVARIYELNKALYEWAETLPVMEMGDLSWVNI